MGREKKEPFTHHYFTHFSYSETMSKLTALEIRNAKKKSKPYKLNDGRGLYLHIATSGFKSWVYRFKINKKESMVTLGEYPTMSLQEARASRSEARELVKEGKSPSRAKQKKRQKEIAREIAEKQVTENSFEQVAHNWIDTQKDNWSPKHGQAVLKTLEKDVFPFIGEVAVEEITPPLILKTLKRIEKRGALVIAAKVQQRLTAVLRFAVQSGLTTSNPATEMKGVLKTRKVKHQPALTHKELPEFLRKLSESDIHPTTKLALQFTILTAGRTGEIRGAKWHEIDFDTGLWEIPAKRMKMNTPHTVPLSEQAIAILKRIGVMWGETGYIFPGIRQDSKQLSENTLLYAMYRLGYHSKATVHGFRATFSTIANESGFEPDIIEKALAHEERNAVRKAYNRSEYIEQRRKLMQWWADLLDQLKMKRNTYNFK